MNIKDLENAVVYFSFTSREGGEYAYLFLIVNHKFYWIDENYNNAVPQTQDFIDSYTENIENGDYEEQYDLDSYDSLDAFLEEFGNDRKDVVEGDCECDGCWDYASANGEYVISVFVGNEKVYEKIIS